MAQQVGEIEAVAKYVFTLSGKNYLLNASDSYSAFVEAALKDPFRDIGDKSFNKGSKLVVDPAFLSALRQWVELSTEQSTDDILHYSRETGLSVIQLNVLFFMSHQQTLPVSEIGAKLGITRSAASQLIDHLVKKGYLSRREGHPDRRLRQIRLTDKGLALVKEFDEARFHWIEKMGSTLSLAQQESIIHSLSELAEAARKIGGGEDDNQQNRSK